MRRILTEQNGIVRLTYSFDEFLSFQFDLQQNPQRFVKRHSLKVVRPCESPVTRGKYIYGTVLLNLPQSRSVVSSVIHVDIAGFLVPS